MSSILFEGQHESYSEFDYFLQCMEVGQSASALLETLGFSWEMKDAHSGKMIAHVAATIGILPDDFTQWALTDKNGDSVAHLHVRHHTLPIDFPHWGLKNRARQSVARAAIESGTLPEGFDQWEIDFEGRPLPHAYLALHGRLPAGFSSWHIADHDGETIAHRAASLGVLPEDFCEWSLKTQTWSEHAQETVAERVRKGLHARQHAMLDAFELSLKVSQQLGAPTAHEAKPQGRPAAIFRNRGMS